MNIRYRMNRRVFINDVLWVSGIFVAALALAFLLDVINVHAQTVAITPPGGTLTTVDGLLNYLLADPTHIVMIAAALCAITPTPHPATFAGKAYKVLELLALNVLKAKDPGTYVSVGAYDVRNTDPKNPSIPPSIADVRAATAAAAVVPPAPPTPPLVMILCLIGVGLALAACTPRTLSAVNATYQAVGTAGTIAINSGVVSAPATVAKIKAADSAAYAGIHSANVAVEACPRLSPTQIDPACAKSADVAGAIAAADSAVGSLATIVAGAGVAVPAQ